MSRYLLSVVTPTDGTPPAPDEMKAIIVDAPDLDGALEWGRTAARAIGLPIEVRPFQWA